VKHCRAFLLLAGFVASACNLPESIPLDPQLGTAAAMTVQAALDDAVLITPVTTPGTESGETLPAFSKPVVSVVEVTNCRSGPDTNYERITQVTPGQQVEILGYFPPIYWLVDTPQGVCWLYGEFATPAGSWEVLPTVTAPPTPLGTSPQAPTFLKTNGWTYFCRNTGQADITLSWNDKSNNETGFRILRNGESVAELPANSTYFAETITLLSGQSVGYQVQAYNLIGETNSIVASMTCP
jgi:hypothetical protein